MRGQDLLDMEEGDVDGLQLLTVHRRRFVRLLQSVRSDADRARKDPSGHERGCTAAGKGGGGGCAVG
jgi:hypothetical protein